MCILHTINHRTLSHGTQGLGGVPDGGPLGLPPGGLDGSQDTRTAAGRGGSDGRTGVVPGLTSMSTAMSEKDRGLDDSAAVHSQRDRYGGTGMAERPIPEVWHRAP